MINSKTQTEYIQNKAYSKADWDEVSDNPAMTREELKRLRPAQEVLPPAIYDALVMKIDRQKSANNDEA